MTIGAGIAKVSGLPGAGLDELIRFPGDLYGIAFDLDETSIGVVLLGDYRHLNTDDPVARTGRVMDIPVGEGLIGRVIDPLGRPLDGKGSRCVQPPAADRAASACDHGPRTRDGAVANRDKGHRRIGPDRPWAAGTDPG